MYLSQKCSRNIHSFTKKHKYTDNVLLSYWNVLSLKLIFHITVFCDLYSDINSVKNRKIMLQSRMLLVVLISGYILRNLGYKWHAFSFPFQFHNVFTFEHLVLSLLWLLKRTHYYYLPETKWSHFGKQELVIAQNFVFEGILVACVYQVVRQLCQLASVVLSIGEDQRLHRDVA